MRLPRKYWLETLWAVFAAASVTSVFFLTEWETIPFHVGGVSLSLLCCFRLWSFWATAAVLAIVTAIFAILAFRKQSAEVSLLQEQVLRDAMARHRAQATQVFTWPGQAPLYDDDDM